MSKKHKYWLKHIRAWERSGQTQAEYCRNQGVSFSSFQYYRLQVHCEIEGKKEDFLPISAGSLRGIEIRKGEVTVSLPLDTSADRIVELAQCLL